MNLEEFDIEIGAPSQFIGASYISELPSVFISPKFMQTVAESLPVKTFALMRKSDRKIGALAHFTAVNGSEYVSPGRGSFGGMHCDPALAPDIAFHFASRIEQHFLESGARSISITLPPLDYDIDGITHEINSWRRLGFNIERMEVNYSIPVRERPFDECVEHSVRKRIKKCLREGFTARELPLQELPQAYSIIAANRAARGFPLTMSLEALEKTASMIAPAVRVFCVEAADRMAAAAIVYEINSAIDYVFYWGDAPGFEQFSPVTLLANHLYERAIHNRKRYLDLGVSTVNEEPNLGLVKFKRNLGAEASPKFRLIKSYPFD